MAKINLPNSATSGLNYSHESTEYDRLYKLYSPSRTQVGQLSFTSNSSNTTYNTSTYNTPTLPNVEVNNKGQEGMLKILFDVLKDSLLTADDFNNAGNSMGYYTTSTSSVVTDHIAYNVQTGKNITLADGNRCLWKADKDSDNNGGQNNYIPNMTSNTSPSPFVASADSEFNINQAAWRAFEISSFSWISTNTALPHWLKIDLGTAKPLGSYTVNIKGFGSDNPSNWTFEGSNDNSNWDILDTQTSVQSQLEQTFVINSLVEYRYYRIHVTAVTSGVLCDIRQLQISTLVNITGTPTLLVDNTSATNITVKDGGNITKDKYYESIYDGSTWLTTEMVQSLKVSNLVHEEVIQSGVASVTIPNLDINRDGGVYEIIINNLKATTSILKMFVNNDIATTNYSNQKTTETSAQNDSSLYRPLLSPLKSNVTINLTINEDKALAFSEGTGISTTNVAIGSVINWAYLQNISNISELTFGLVSGTFTSGTIKIYKRS